ncbi:MAG: hypothetical protein OEZ68_03845 [Gammaproteobacteria bacterium]|nr:hypothetical protein [Gammaproteobacteria bacterium]MDH5799918.1 hypothetical protein [Gammaproteobacteria bacterium]
MSIVTTKKIYVVMGGFFLLGLSACDRPVPAQTQNCPGDKPYYPLCTHSVHGKTTWLGACAKSWEDALQASEKHVAAAHPGEKRWTGVKKLH